MKSDKSSFAVFFGNRGFFPASLQAGARKEMTAELKNLGHKVLTLDAKATRHGAIETPLEGAVYANFLRENAGNYDGVILCLPNFGDETGAIAALKDAGVPILIQAYPDELDKMAPEVRRDSFCGKFSIMDVFCQYGLKFTALKPHTVHPTDRRFADNIDYFDRLCRVVKKMRSMTIGAVGARTTAFKTVRIDEIALQRHGITMETLDMSDVFARMNALKLTDSPVVKKAKILQKYTNWGKTPKHAFETLTKLGVVLDSIAEELRLDAMAVRCWIELQQQYGVSPCILLSEMNNRCFPVACEVDVGSAVTMCALRVASGSVATCLDWNNNYGNDDNKCILFHCGPVPQDMMTCTGEISDHAILANTVGKGCSFGCNEGRIKPGPFTFGNLITDSGKLKFYLGEGKFTKDKIPADFFGCAGVAEFPDLQQTLLTIGLEGHRHHTAVTPGCVMVPVKDAFENYLEYQVTAV